MKKNEGLTERLKARFACRLSELAQNNGFYRNKKPYFVDVKSLAKKLDMSEVMLRRYLAGMIFPSESILFKAAALFKVDPYWLYTGEKMQNRVDKPLMTSILTKLWPEFQKKTKGGEVNMQLIELVCEAYDEINALSQVDETEKHRLLNWMLTKISENSIDEVVTVA